MDGARSLHRSGVDEHRDAWRQKASHTRHYEEAIKGIAFLPILGQTLAEVAQAGRVEGREVEWQMQGNLPAQIKQDAFDGLVVRDIVMILQEQYATHERGRQTGPAIAGIIQVLQIVVLEQASADVRHAPVKRIRRDPVWHHIRIEETGLGIATTQHGLTPCLRDLTGVYHK